MKRRMMGLYHVSPAVNRESIKRTGVDPGMSRGARAESWYVMGESVCWAILHVRKRHGVFSLDAIDVWQVTGAEETFTRRGRGKFTARERLLPGKRLSWHDFATGLDDDGRDVRNNLPAGNVD
jgi:hypothetical protein